MARFLALSAGILRVRIQLIQLIVLTPCIASLSQQNENSIFVCCTLDLKRKIEIN